MGKHSRRKSGYLPKVAAGAAPVALLFAAPATALATQSDITLPLDRIELPLGPGHRTTLDSDGDTLSATRRDVVVKRVGDAWVEADHTEAMAASGDRAGVAEQARQGVWPADGVDVLSEHTEELDTGLFTGDLTGGITARRSSGQAVDLGGLGAVGTTSEQQVVGSFAGVLDVRQEHALGGQLGPAFGLVRTTQTRSVGSFSGDLGVDHVVHVQGTTTSLRGTLAASVFDRPVFGR
ncbi:hypothetical protein [Amycolatopsis sp. cmx-4-68]|uniref:hypothetical protein n=1 Tax=Amycolatopsis sp. cmx-4-68 TaxID=2790938 RepID=UPI003979E385